MNDIDLANRGLKWMNISYGESKGPSPKPSFSSTSSSPMPPFTIFDVFLILIESLNFVMTMQNYVTCTARDTPDFWLVAQ